MFEKNNYYENLLKLDKKNIWHPYTQMKDYENQDHVLIKKAKGLKLYDFKNNYYYDTISSWWCNILGHNIPEINHSIQKQIKKFEHVLFAGFTNEPSIKLSEKLLSISHPVLQKVFFSDNGSTAVEVALKLSYQYWQNIGKNTRKSFIFLENGYHGDTIGAMSVSGVSQFNNVFKQLFYKAYSIPSPYCYHCPMRKSRETCDIECLQPLEKLLAKKASGIAGIILEPLVQAAGGMIIYPSTYLDKLYNIISKYKIHIILDEIAVGFGRTGKIFAYQYSDIKPDFVCVSKALTNGTLPLGVTLTTNDIYQAYYDDYLKFKTFYHGHTFTGNPISSSIALTTLNIIEKENLVEKGNIVSLYLRNKLEKYKDFKYFGDIRQIGLIAAIEVVKDKKKTLDFPLKERIGWKIYLEGLRQNLLLRPLGNIIYFYLPLTTQKKDIDQILSRFDKVINNIFPS